MHTLNLIYPEQSDIPYQQINFPDGQPHLRLDMDRVANMNRRDPVRILCRLNGPATLLLALFAKNVLDYQGFEEIELHISYLFSARMDRVMTDGEPFSLKVIAALINNAAFKKVRIFDPHSEVSTALIDRSYSVTNHRYVKDAMDNYLEKTHTSNYCIVSPDAGALKKIYKLAQFLNVEQVVECTKERDPKTGKLTNFKTTEENLVAKTCFIIDDICDGGGTFAGTAGMLKEKGADKVVLIVSHGIFSKGVSIDSVDEIYTTDSFKQVDGINCFRIDRYM